MSKAINVVLYDSDGDYIDSFGEYLKSNNKKGIIFSFFTDITSLLEYCAVETMDIIIIAEYLFCEEGIKKIISKNPDKILILCDEKDITHIDDFLCVYRFQRADYLINIILEICAERINSNHNIHRYLRKINTKKLGFFSPIGRCGKTKLTIEVCKKLANEGKKVLLINLEEFSLLDNYLGSCNDNNISDLLFYYISDRGSFDIKSDIIIKNYHGFDYISPVKCVDDLRNIEYEVWNDFFSMLAANRRYDVIIIEVTNMVKEYLKLLDSMDMIFLPYLDDNLCREKLDKFKEYISISEYKSLKDKLSELVVENNEEINTDIVENIIRKFKVFTDVETQY